MTVGEKRSRFSSTSSTFFSAASTLATSEYSIPVTGAVRRGLVYGTQFHPEKSGDTGLRLLKAFAEL